MDPNATEVIDYCKLGIIAPPQGITPNFVDPPSLGPVVIAVGVTLGIISGMLVAGRLYTNWGKTRSADWFSLVGFLFNIALTGVIFAQQKLYRHAWDVPICWYNAKSLKLVLAQTQLFAPAFFFSKAAILLLYRQVFAINRGGRMAIDAGLVVTLLTYLSNIPMAAIYSAPRVGQTWESLLLNFAESSRPLSIAGVVQSAVGTLIDIYIFLLPLPILLRLHLPKKRVLGLVGIFSTALLGVSASVVSLVYKTQLLDSGRDTSWLGALTSLCTLIETGIAIIVGCMPAFASLLSNTVGVTTLLKSLRSHIFGSASRLNSSKNTAQGDTSMDVGGSGSRGVSHGQRSAERRDSPYLRLSDGTPREEDEYELQPRSAMR